MLLSKRYCNKPETNQTNQRCLKLTLVNSRSVLLVCISSCWSISFICVHLLAMFHNKHKNKRKWTHRDRLSEGSDSEECVTQKPNSKKNMVIPMFDISQSSSGWGSVSIFGLRHTQSYLSSCTLVSLVTTSEERAELCLHYQLGEFGKHSMIKI